MTFASCAGPCVRSRASTSMRSLATSSACTDQRCHGHDVAHSSGSRAAEASAYAGSKRVTTTPAPSTRAWQASRSFAAAPTRASVNASSCPRGDSDARALFDAYPAGAAAAARRADVRVRNVVREAHFQDRPAPPPACRETFVIAHLHHRTFAQHAPREQTRRREHQNSICDQDACLQHIERVRHANNLLQIFRNVRTPGGVGGELLHHFLAGFSEADEREHRDHEQDRQHQSADALPHRLEHQPGIHADRGVNPDRHHHA